MSQQAQAEGQQQEGLQREAEIRRLCDANLEKLLAGDMEQEAYDSEVSRLDASLTSIEKYYDLAERINLNTSRGLSIPGSARAPTPSARRPITSETGGTPGESPGEASPYDALSKKLDAIARLQGPPVAISHQVGLSERERWMLNAYLRPATNYMPRAKAMRESLTAADMEYLWQPRTEKLLNAFVDRAGGFVTAEEMGQELINLRELEVGLVSRARQIQTDAMSISFPTAAVVFDYAKRGTSGQHQIDPIRLIDVFGRTRFQPNGRDVILKVPRELVEDPGFDLIPFLGVEANRISREEDELLMIRGSGAGEPFGYVRMLEKLFAEGATEVGVVAGKGVPAFSGSEFTSEYIQVFDTELIANARGK